MTRLLDGSTAAFGRGATRAAVAGIIAGAAAILAGLATGNGRLVFGVLDANWLFFSGLAAGALALSAAIRAAQGRWASALTPVAEAGSSFFAPSLVLLAVLVLGARIWIAWTRDAAIGSVVFLAVRDLSLVALLYGAGRRYLAAVRAGAVLTAPAIVYLLIYAAVMSVVAFDLVMSLYEGAASTIVPALYFTGALLAGLAGSTLAADVRGRLDTATRHDAAVLLFSLATFWAYLVWAAFLPTWYGNIPEETALLLARWDGGYKPVTVFTLLATALVPFALLIVGAGKRNPAIVRLAAASVFAGLFAESLLFVLPDLDLTASAISLVLGSGVTAGVAGIFLLSLGNGLSRAGRSVPAAEHAADV